jgi:hypothetical protein
VLAVPPMAPSQPVLPHVMALHPPLARADDGDEVGDEPMVMIRADWDTVCKAWSRDQDEGMRCGALLDAIFVKWQTSPSPTIHAAAPDAAAMAAMDAIFVSSPTTTSLDAALAHQLQTDEDAAAMATGRSPRWGVSPTPPVVGNTRGGRHGSPPSRRRSRPEQRDDCELPPSARLAGGFIRDDVSPSATLASRSWLSWIRPWSWSQPS